MTCAPTLPAPPRRTAAGEDALDEEKSDEEERELRERETLLALEARPPRPFNVATFDRLWSGATREECERALFRLLDEWAMARPCATAAVWRHSRRPRRAAPVD